MVDQDAIDAPTREYLAALSERCRNLLGNRLVGLYLQGSVALHDYRPGKSDIDALGVIDGPWPAEAKQVLAEKIGHAQLPVPAPGLDFILVAADVAAHPGARPAYELWYSTGETWPVTELEVEGRTSEMLVHFATCRQAGQTLLGAPADRVFAEPAYDAMLRALVEILEWHAGRVLDDFHDPLGQHSVLNACRAWRYAEERTLSSKSAGAEWLLAREPNHDLVRGALAIRRGEVDQALDADDIRRFLSQVVEVCRSRMGSGPG